MRDGLRQHLYKRHEKTGAKLDKVKEELTNGSSIGIAVFQVAPDKLRHYYEERLIQSFELEWNLQKHKK
ncbi:hypothetical protein [uncultured Aquimarina sp.]|uniref:hypothetical protein n=1 Tax=uncultured Aquimarina sp. TaxID=575652 RepID=UPI00262D25C7|nr:hypothetical protein [uncultured Aquimarina sp.]